MGLKLNHQRISEIFRNPFYCGLMSHNMLEGRVIKGNHETLVSQEIFLKVNGLLDQLHHGYKLVEENPYIPLKRFVSCSKCGRLLRGYIVKGKEIYYYKCSTPGCCVNKNASVLNSTFVDILNHFALKDEILKHSKDLIIAQMTATFNNLSGEQEDEFMVLEKQLFELDKKIRRLEERYIEETMDPELYNKYIAKYSSERELIQQNLMKGTGEKSNLSHAIAIALDLGSKLAFKWRKGTYQVKQKIQYLLFPGGLSYSKLHDKCRTGRINFVFLYLAYIQQVIGNKKSGIPELSLDFAAFADLVAGSRIELPTLGL